MNRTDAENISMLVDGEVTDAGFDEVLKQLSDTDELQQDWQDYHLIGDAMRRALPDTLNFDVSARVSAAIDAEPAYLLPALGQQKADCDVGRTSASVTALPRRRAVPAIGFALAASLSALAIFNLGQLSPTAEPVSAPSLASSERAVPQLAAVDNVQAPPVATTKVSLANEERAAIVQAVLAASRHQNVAASNVSYPQEAADFYDYLVNYSRYSQSGGGNDMLRHVSLASY